MMAIAAIHHDAAGRRLEIDRPLADGRLIRTRYRHDPLTGRVTGIYILGAASIPAAGWAPASRAIAR